MKKDWNYYKDNFGTLDDVLNSVDEKDFSVIAESFANPENINENSLLNFQRKYSLATVFAKAFAAPAITKHLDELGFRKFKVFATGDFALLLESTNGQLIRISSSGGEDSNLGKGGQRGGSVPLSSAVLQPIQTLEVQGLNIVIFPEIRKPERGELTEESLYALRTKLAEDGLYYEDLMIDHNKRPQHPRGNIQERNVGVLKDGTPVLLDSDSVIHIDDVKPRDQDKIRKELEEFRAYGHDFEWENSDKTWKQHEEFPHIWNSGKPEAGQLTGVYPRDEVEAAREKIGDDADKEKILDDVAAGYGEDAARRVVDAAESQGRLNELATRIKGKSL